MRKITSCVLALAVTAGGFVGVVRGAAAEGTANRPPNVVLILADDLGVGEVGCYGQTKIHTPNIDRLAAEGMRFVNAYSPSPVCAPTRCSLLTGLNLGHSYVRDNKEVQPEGQLPIPDETVTVAERLKTAGYATACVGKWGLGPVGSSGDPIKQGFDFFYGHNCQRVAHNHYTDHVWRNDERIDLEGNVKGNLVGKQYAPDLMADEAVKWLREHKGGPFFLYFATPLPHVSLQAPAEAVAQYHGKLGEEKPFVPVHTDYVGCAEPHATYAAMVTRIDDYVGRIMAELKALGLDDNTVVVFASDNGPTYNAGTDSAYFESAMGRKGLKEQVYEGGIRVPLVVRWPGHVRGGTESQYVTALYDLFPTFTDLAGLPTPAKTDGISLVPVVEGKDQRPHETMYWEIFTKGGRRALRKGDWKLVQTEVKQGGAVHLYNLATDPDETTDVSKEHPDLTAELTKLMTAARTPSPIKAWNFNKDETPAAAQ